VSLPPLGPPPPRGCSVEERIDFICELIARGDYRSGTTTYDLARRWGLTVATVHGYAGEAGRRLRCPKEHLEALKQAHIALLEAVLHDAKQTRNKMTNQPDYRSFVEAWKAYSSYGLGWNPDREAKAEGPKPEDLSDEELKELVEKALAASKNANKSERPEPSDRSGPEGSTS
jgi:hypothetical protein